ncbi:phosphatase PAP2 family protein [Romboutsia lituseburensis]|uniref:phosphatase PAP2 family protein n=1 Tax=Romboutsia lituseburensis TaxID=1537 RepID=UPI00215A967E|nr:phosphatase PAP2 family protein [Romboutsia lituseburensis]MCR8745397.1 phosphatase PAP2 family protein [Romboutsia lituseburensis]
MDIQLSILQFFQQIRSPLLNTIFLIFTISTEVPVIIAITAYMYWCLNKKYGQKMLFSLVGNITLNTGIKEFFRAPRPIGIKGLNSMRVSTATGYSFPSGHTQTATTFWTSLAVIFRSSGLTILAIIMILGVGISRLYLAVHWPIDVIFGWILGVIFTVLLCKIFDYVDSTKKYWILILVLIPFIVSMFIVNSNEYIKIFGLLTGYVLGYIVEDMFINFKTEYRFKGKIQFSKNSRLNIDKSDKIKRDMIRFLIGLVTLAAVYFGLKYILPNNVIFDYIRYTVVVFYAIAGVPFIFQLLNLD